MSQFASILTGLVIVVTAFPAHANDKAVQEIELDEHVVYTVPVSAGRITTISFPGPIAAIDAALVTTDAKHAGLFQISHTPGAYFFSCKSLVKDARTNVNVRWNNKTYVIALEDSTRPVFSLIFRFRRDGGRDAKGVRPAILLGLLDKAKAYPLLKESHPEAVEQVDYFSYGDKPRVMDFDDFEVRIEQVFRFEVQDTLVFQIVLRNKTDAEIRYQPQSFAVRIGEHVYPSSISDASGVMPPKSDSPAYFAVTGTPNGGRNDLSIKNDFTVLVTRGDSPVNGNGEPALPEKGDGYSK